MCRHVVGPKSCELREHKQGCVEAHHMTGAIFIKSALKLRYERQLKSVIRLAGAYNGMCCSLMQTQGSPAGHICILKTAPA